jgi:hypothetical protein
MRKSELYRQRAQEADHVLAALGLHTKALKEERKERFEERWLPLLMEKKVLLIKWTHPVFKYEITYITNGKQETIDFFPKANKVLIRSQNKWIKPGLRWIVKNILKENYEESH